MLVLNCKDAKILNKYNIKINLLYRKTYLQMDYIILFVTMMNKFDSI